MKLPEHYRVFPNAVISDGKSVGLEFDVIVVGDWAVHLLESKAVEGHVDIRPDVWEFEDGRMVPSPVPGLVRRARSFSGWLIDRLGGKEHCPWCQPLLVIARGDDNVHVFSGPRDSLVVLADDLFNALASREALSTDASRKVAREQRDAVADVLMKQGNLESENREWQWHV